MRDIFGRWLAVLAAAACLTLALPVEAEKLLYRHVDKDGKVTYSDKPPKENEKATVVKVDPNVNTIKLNSKDSSGKEQKFSNIKERGDARAALRDKLQGEIKTAETERDKAKKALESGQDPLPGETRIVVNKGGNSIMRLPEYHARISGLEEALKKAEEKVKDAEGKFRRQTPD